MKNKINENTSETNWIQSGTKAKTLSLQLLRCMLRTQRLRLSIYRLLCYYLNHNSICAHQDLSHIRALRRHNGISLWMNLDTKINGPTTHVVPNSKLARLGCPKLLNKQTEKKKRNKHINISPLFFFFLRLKNKCKSYSQNEAKNDHNPDRICCLLANVK